MSKSRRAQVLLEPETYHLLEQIAEREGTSISELIRIAIEKIFTGSPERRQRALEGIVALELPIADWEELEQEILDARAAHLSR
jgi:hypothetical protein